MAPKMYDNNGNEVAQASIPGFGERYVIYENGMIYSNPAHRFLFFSKRKNGYIRCALRKSPNGKLHDFLVHRLVCSIFNGEAPEGKNCVNHIDCNKENNHASNLEWCSYADNMHHASLNGLLSAQSNRMHTRNVNSKKPVEALDNQGKIVMTFQSVQDARSKYSSVSWSIKTGRKGNGYYWRYAE